MISDRLVKILLLVIILQSLAITYLEIKSYYNTKFFASRIDDIKFLFEEDIDIFDVKVHVGGKE